MGAMVVFRSTSALVLKEVRQTVVSSGLVLATPYTANYVVLGMRGIDMCCA